MKYLPNWISNINKKNPKLIRKSFRRFKQRISIHFILTNYENSVILKTAIFLSLNKHNLNLETILFSTLLHKFFRKLGEMLLTGNTHAFKTKPLCLLSVMWESCYSAGSTIYWRYH